MNGTNERKRNADIPRRTLTRYNRVFVNDPNNVSDGSPRARVVRSSHAIVGPVDPPVCFYINIARTPRSDADLTTTC